MRTPGLVLSVLMWLPAVAAADEVDRYVEGFLRREHVPGLSLVVVHHGRVVKSRGYGLADLEHQVPAGPQTVYEIGSVTKQLTAVAVMQLVEEGRLALDDPLTRYFPDAPGPWSRITIRHLLTHTSGIQNHVAVPGYMSVFRSDLTFAGSPAPDELLKKFQALPLEFEPGETWAYDNTGYILLGWIVEKASGRPFMRFLEERVLDPLGMSATSSTDPRAIVPNRASGYGWSADGFENREVLWPHVASAAGSLLSTAEDLARFHAGLDAGRLLRGRERLLEPARTRDGALPPYDYGFGWFVDSWHGHRLVHHSGGSPGFSALTFRFPDDGLSVVALMNRGDRMMEQLAIDVAGLYVRSLRRPEGTADPDPATTARLRSVLEGLLAGRHDPAQFTRPMQLFLGTATGRVFPQWFAEHGTLGAFRFSSREELPGGHRLLHYGVVLGETRYWFSFELDGEGRIAQLTSW